MVRRPVQADEATDESPPKCRRISEKQAPSEAYRQLQERQNLDFFLQSAMQVAPKVGKQSRLYRCAPEHLRNLSPRESENPEVREAPGMIHFPQALGSGVFQYQDLTSMNNSNNDVPSPSDQTNSSSNSSRALARAVAVQALAARGGAPLARSCLSRCPSRCHHLSADTRHVPEHTTIFLS